MVESIDRLAQLETKRTGLPVDRSGIVRRALEEDLKRRQDEQKKDGAA
jgi:metal-responsive CopG/Arc/MetJ family transcriptional regulator